MDSAAKTILDAYRDHLLEEGKDPATVFKFCKKIDLEEKVFYDHFPSFKSIRANFWAEQCRDVLDGLEKDSTFQDYGPREQWLAFLFTYFENLTANRSFALALYPKGPQLKHQATFKKLREVYKPWALQWIQNEADEDDLIPEKLKTESAWMLFLFLHHFWKQDESKGFERTDAAIEKTVNLYYQLIDPSVLSTAIDFAKFMAPEVKSPMDFLTSIKDKFK